MRKTFLAPLSAVAATLAFAVPGVAMAQDTTETATTYEAEPTAPDGTKAFGIEPYVGIQGGHAMFDRDTTGSDITPRYDGGKYSGTLVEGVAGVNVPLGPVFVGVEGSVAKGVAGDINWQYGVAGRAGVRAGESGMIYGKYGREWVTFDRDNVGRPAMKPGEKSIGNPVYGVGVEVGPKDIGLGGVTGNSGIRLRLEANTTDFNSIRPMGGVVMHF